MFTCNHQDCPICGVPVAMEHTATESYLAIVVTWLRCDFCGRIWERLFDRKGDELAERIACEWDRARDPVRYGKALQRFERARQGDQRAIDQARADAARAA